MNLVSNFDPALTRICVLDYYPFEQRIPLFFESDLDKIKNDQNKTVITTYNFTGYPILKPHIEDFLIYRLKNNLQTVVIYDFSFESHLQDQDIDIILSYFQNLGLDIEKQLLILNNNWENSDERSYTYTYDVWAVDAYFWLTSRPDKFTTLPLAKRPQLFNLVISKLNQKKSRGKIVYEFYKNNLLNRCLLSVMGDLQEFEQISTDKEFLKEMEQRITNIGGAPIQYNEGKSNIEFMHETSNRTLFNNSILSCVLETCFSKEVGDKTEWIGHSFLTEKFYRCIVNKTPFIVYGKPNLIDEIEKMGFNDFGSVINLEFDKIWNEKPKIEKYVHEVETFLDNFPDRINEIQAICDHNYEVFLKHAAAEYKYYQDRISNFLN